MKNAVLFMFAVMLTFVGCKNMFVPDEEPKNDYIIEKALDFQKSSDYAISVINTEHNYRQIENGMVVRVKTGDTYHALQFHHGADNSQYFIIAWPRMPECYQIPSDKPNQNGSWRMTYNSAGPEPFPQSHRSEQTGDTWTMVSLGKKETIWVMIEKWDDVMGEYMAASPWVMLVFDQDPIDDPEERRDGNG